MVNGWKILAIILLIIVIAESYFIYNAYSVGTNDYNNKVKCSNEICFNKGYDSFTYESNTCNCWVGDEIVYKEIMK